MDRFLQFVLLVIRTVRRQRCGNSRVAIRRMELLEFLEMANSPQSVAQRIKSGLRR